MKRFPEVTFVAHRIARVGGMERAAAEVANRLARSTPVRLVAALGEADTDRVTISEVKVASRAAVLRCLEFRHKANEVLRREPSTGLRISIGAAFWPVDVVVIQFCHWAFGDLPAAVRPGWHQRIANRFFRWEERAALRCGRLQGVIAVSSGVAAEVERYHQYPADRIRVVPNGVDPAVFRPLPIAERVALRAEHGLAPDEFVAIFAGGDWSRKGLGYALEAVQAVPDVRLLVVGHGGREEGRFAEQARGLGIAHRVTFVGQTPRPQTYFQMADVLVFPTFYEAFSLVSIEASACGLPVIMTPVNGAAELVRDGENGFLCERDGAQIAKWLRLLKGDRDRLAAMSAAAHRTSEAYHWDEVAARFAEALTELTGWRPGA